MEPSKVKVLTLDIETSPCIVYVWGLGKQYINKDNLLQDWHIMSFSAKWATDPASKVIYRESRGTDDTALVTKLWDLLNEADIVVTQNGRSFDEPRIKARMMLAGLKPYKPVQHYDTFIENRDKEFTSHSLDYLTDKFCTKYKKLKHKRFPGLSLWKECLGIELKYHPNPKAWKEMKDYNIHDTLSTEELYINTRGWSTKKAPSIMNDATRHCKMCGEARLIKRGTERTAKQVFIRMQCQSCGKWQRGGRIK